MLRMPFHSSSQATVCTTAEYIIYRDTLPHQLNTEPDWCAGHGEDVEQVVLHQYLHLLPLLSSLPLLVGHLVPPQAVLVVAGEAVDNDGYGEGEDEDAAEGAQTADQLAWKR